MTTDEFQRGFVAFVERYKTLAHICSLHLLHGHPTEATHKTELNTQLDKTSLFPG